MKRDYYSGFFFNPHELAKIVLKSSTKYYCTKLHYLVYRTEQKRFFRFSRVTYHTRRDQRVPPSNFFRHCETFFPENFFHQRVPPSIFLLFCDRMDVGKSQRVPPFSFFRHCEIFFQNENFSPFNFLMFCDRMDVEKPQRLPPFVFRHCETFIRKFFSPKGSPFNCDKNVDNFSRVPLLARHSVHVFECIFFEKFFFVIFSIFEYCKREYLTLGSLFAIFEPWIWRRRGPVPACFYYYHIIMIFIHYTCDKQVLWESAGAFFSARQLSDFTRQLARFTRSWSSGKMLAFQPRGFVFEPVGMR